MQIFSEEVFQKDNFLAFYRQSQRLKKIRKYTRDRLKTKSSTLKNYKIIYQSCSYFIRSFQNINFIQLVYYFSPEDYPKNCENVIKLD